MFPHLPLGLVRISLNSNKLITHLPSLQDGGTAIGRCVNLIYMGSATTRRSNGVDACCGYYDSNK